MAERLDQSRTYDPETLDILKAALEDAWAALSSRERALTSKSEIAARILDTAAHGERNRERLCALALQVR